MNHDPKDLPYLDKPNSGQQQNENLFPCFFTISQQWPDFASQKLRKTENRVVSALHLSSLKLLAPELFF